MFHKAINRTRPLGFLFLLITSFSLALAQESSVASHGGPLANLRPRTLNWPELTNDAATILARFVEVETKSREALNQHTFKRDVVLQTIARTGEVTGEYVRNSKFLF